MISCSNLVLGRCKFCKLDIPVPYTPRMYSEERFVFNCKDYNEAIIESVKEPILIKTEGAIK